MSHKILCDIFVLNGRAMEMPENVIYTTFFIEKNHWFFGY